MQLFDQIALKEDGKMYHYLQLNSWYIKDLNRGFKSFVDFKNEMNVKYKQRVTDKLDKAMENIELISSVLDVLK
ncbi:MAG: hypothetical protein E7172_04690 [Firmicutes bacterium]|nr:hypothetical protein [Bacillota bacterium]